MWWLIPNGQDQNKRNISGVKPQCAGSMRDASANQLAKG
jgi:hypothetical protein